MSNLILLSIPVDQLIPTRGENSTTFCVIPDKNFTFSSSFQQTLLRWQLRYLHVALSNLTNPVVQFINSILAESYTVQSNSDLWMEMAQNFPFFILLFKWQSWLNLTVNSLVATWSHLIWNQGRLKDKMWKKWKEISFWATTPPATPPNHLHSQFYANK